MIFSLSFSKPLINYVWFTLNEIVKRCITFLYWLILQALELAILLFCSTLVLPANSSKWKFYLFYWFCKALSWSLLVFPLHLCLIKNIIWLVFCDTLNFGNLNSFCDWTFRKLDSQFNWPKFSWYKPLKMGLYQAILKWNRANFSNLWLSNIIVRYSAHV